MKSSIDELMAFTAIVDTGSIVCAAEQLQQTASGVSRALTRLEKKLGITLLARTTRKIKLTQEGEIFLVKTRQILNDLTAAEEALLHSDRDISGLLRVDAATSFVLHRIAPLICKFRTQYPNLNIELNSNDQVIDLLECRTDVAIRIGELSDSTLHSKKLMKSRLYLVASPQYLKQWGKPQCVEDLYQHQLIGFSQHPNLNLWPVKQEQKTFKAKASLTANTGETIRHLVLNHNGIACLSAFLVTEDMEQGNLESVLDDEVILKYQTVQAVYYKHAHTPKRIRLFIEFLAKHLNDMT